MNYFTNLLKNAPLKSCLICGILTSLSFAPVFFIPSLVCVGCFAYIISIQTCYKDAFWSGYIYGFGYFLSGLYWVAIGVSVYWEQFWWAVPIALFGLPIFFGQFFGLIGIISYYFSKRVLYTNSFTSIWLLSELLRGVLYTGFPWNLIGYSFAFSDVMLQTTSIFGIYGLSVLTVFSFASIHYILSKEYKKFAFILLFAITPLWYSAYQYGYNKLSDNPVSLGDIKIRIAQPSIQQTDKWSMDRFWDNLYQHLELSISDISSFKPDIIVWPESAVVLRPTYVDVYNALQSLTIASHATLITGGITDNASNPQRSRDRIYASIYAMDPKGHIIFDYHKSHLVPFGEYVPFSEYISYMNKFTPGDQEYSPGVPGFIVHLDQYNIKIRPLLCYESIFPDEVLMSNKKADIILNLTNDAWYGISSGPYQHFYMARVRAVESALPLIRATNNGVSGIIDPYGRILQRTILNDVICLDGVIPNKPETESYYSKYRNKYLYIYIGLSLILSLFCGRKKQ